MIPIEVHAPKSVRVSQMDRGRGGLILSGRQHATITATSHHRSFSCTRRGATRQPFEWRRNVVVAALSDDGGDVINPPRGLGRGRPRSSSAQPNIDPAQSIGQTRLILRSISIWRGGEGEGGGRQCQQCLSMTLPGCDGRCDTFYESASPRGMSDLDEITSLHSDVG